MLLLAGVALADAVRGGEEGPEPRSDTGQGTTAIAEDPFQPLPGVPAPGSIVLLDSAGCALRQIVVSSGQELPLPPIETGCELWAAPRGGLVAYALEGPYGAFKPFRIVDLSHPDEPLGTFQTSVGVTWSLDGQRASWCHDSSRGFDLAARSGEDPRVLRDCPIAYSPDGRPAFVENNRLVVGGETAATAAEPIVAAAWAREGSLVLLLRSGRLERIVDGEVLASLLGAPASERPVFAPNACGAAFAVPSGQVELWQLCGASGPAGTVEGTAAAVSPDGEWLAVAEDDEVVFHHLTGNLGMTRWAVSARALSWVR